MKRCLWKALTNFKTTELRPGLSNNELNQLKKES